MIAVENPRVQDGRGRTERPQSASRAWSRGYRPNIGIVQRTVGTRALWFADRAQELRELNPTAAFIWSELAAGRPPESVELDLASSGASPQDAHAFVADLLLRWTADGDLYPRDIDDKLPTEGAVRRFDILGFRAAVRLEGVDPGPYDQVFGQFAAAGEADEAYRLVRRDERVYAFADGRCAGSAAEADGVALLKALLTEGFLATIRAGFAVHAACLTRRGAAWLLFGDPGAGKTTLTAALSCRGFRYAADDVTVLRPDGRVEGVPFALALKAGAWTLCEPFLPGLRDLPTFLRADGQRVRYAPPPGVRGEPTAASHMLFLSREDGASPRLDPVDPADALQGLLATSYSPAARLTKESFEAAADLVAGARCLRFTYSDLSQAADALLAEAGDE